MASEQKMARDAVMEWTYRHAPQADADTPAAWATTPHGDLSTRLDRYAAAVRAATLDHVDELLAHADTSLEDVAAARCLLWGLREQVQAIREGR